MKSEGSESPPQLKGRKVERFKDIKIPYRKSIIHNANNSNTRLSPTSHQERYFLQIQDKIKNFLEVLLSLDWLEGKSESEEDRHALLDLLRLPVQDGFALH